MTRVELPRGPNGERRRKDFKAKTQQEAIDKRQRYLTNLDRHIEPEGAVRKVREFGDWWIQHEAPETCNATTLRSYRDALRKHIYPVIGHMRLQEVRGKHVDAVVSTMLEKGLTLSTRKGARRVISTLFAAARRRDLVDDNPVTRSKPPRLAPGEMTRARSVLSPDQVVAVAKALNGHPYEGVFKLALFGGVRRGEALAVTWGDLWTNGETFGVIITKQVKEVPHYSPDGTTVMRVEITPPKTQNGNRRVPIPQWFYEEIMSSRPKVAGDGDLIFMGPQSGPIWPSNVTKAWKKFVTSQSLYGVRLHDTRHSFARNALSAGAPLEALSEVLGHADIGITKNTYASSVNGATEKVGAALYAQLEFAAEVQTLEQTFALPAHGQTDTGG